MGGETKNNAVGWAKLGKIWWPGKLLQEEEFTDEMKQDVSTLLKSKRSSVKPENIYIVKFFNEDNFEIALQPNQILMNVDEEKKFDLIKRAISQMAVKNSKLSEQREKFRSDVLEAEKLINPSGDLTNITKLLDGESLEPKKPTGVSKYADIFPSLKPEKPPTTTPTLTPKGKAGSLKFSFPSSRIISTASSKPASKISPLPSDPSKKYKCSKCSFSVDRVNVITSHMKYCNGTTPQKKGSTSASGSVNASPVTPSPKKIADAPSIVTPVPATPVAPAATPKTTGTGRRPGRPPRKSVPTPVPAAIVASPQKTKATVASTTSASASTPSAPPKKRGRKSKRDRQLAGKQKAEILEDWNSSEENDSDDDELAPMPPTKPPELFLFGSEKNKKRKAEEDKVASTEDGQGVAPTTKAGAIEEDQPPVLKKPRTDKELSDAFDSLLKTTKLELPKWTDKDEDEDMDVDENQMSDIEEDAHIVMKKSDAVGEGEDEIKDAINPEKTTESGDKEQENVSLSSPSDSSKDDNLTQMSAKKSDKVPKKLESTKPESHTNVDAEEMDNSELDGMDKVKSPDTREKTPVKQDEKRREGSPKKAEERKNSESPKKPDEKKNEVSQKKPEEKKRGRQSQRKLEEKKKEEVFVLPAEKTKTDILADVKSREESPKRNLDKNKQEDGKLPEDKSISTRSSGRRSTRRSSQIEAPAPPIQNSKQRDEATLRKDNKEVAKKASMAKDEKKSEPVKKEKSRSKSPSPKRRDEKKKTEEKESILESKKMESKAEEKKIPATKASTPVKTPEPVVDKKERKTPEPVVDKKERKTPEPVVDKKERKTPEPVVDKKERKTPEPVVDKKDRKTPEPAVVKKDRKTPEPPAVVKKDRKTPEPVVDKKERKTPEPVADKKDRKTPEPAVENKKERQSKASPQTGSTQETKKVDLKKQTTPHQSKSKAGTDTEEVLAENSVSTTSPVKAKGVTVATVKATAASPSPAPKPVVTTSVKKPVTASSVPPPPPVVVNTVKTSTSPAAPKSPQKKITEEKKAATVTSIPTPVKPTAGKTVTPTVQQKKPTAAVRPLVDTKEVPKDAQSTLTKDAKGNTSAIVTAPPKGSPTKEQTQSQTGQTIVTQQHQQQQQQTQEDGEDSGRKSPALVAQRVVHLVPVENQDGTITYMLLSLDNGTENSGVVLEQGSDSVQLRVDKVEPLEQGSTPNTPSNPGEMEGIYLDKNVENANQIVSAIAQATQGGAQSTATATSVMDTTTAYVTLAVDAMGAGVAIGASGSDAVAPTGVVQPSTVILQQDGAQPSQDGSGEQQIFYMTEDGSFLDPQSLGLTLEQFQQLLNQ